MSEKSLVMYQELLDPPKSPFLRMTLILVPPFLRGARGDQKCLKLQMETFKTTSKQNPVFIPFQLLIVPLTVP
jgi:hypothetical protein